MFVVILWDIQVIPKAICSIFPLEGRISIGHDITLVKIENENIQVDELLYEVSEISLRRSQRDRRYLSDPDHNHWVATKKVMRYLQKTKYHMLIYRKVDNFEDDYKSTSDYIFTLAGGAIS